MKACVTHIHAAPWPVMFSGNGNSKDLLSAIKHKSNFISLNRVLAAEIGQESVQLCQEAYLQLSLPRFIVFSQVRLLVSLRPQDTYAGQFLS